MKKLKQCYSGKAKTLYQTDDPNLLVMQFRDDISAFNAGKLDKLADKGRVNNYFNAFIMQRLQQAGIAVHFEKILTATESLVKKLAMIPVECVVRNYAAGSLCKRLGIEEGCVLTTPLCEFFYKSDALGDPLVNQDHILAFDWASATEIEQMRELSLKVNQVLVPLFAEAGLILVDFKLEFGRYHGQLLLADEFTPDGCRIWEKETRQKLDKDRFREDLGDVVASYNLVAQRLGVELP
jgi:phosphoribosylaminoimidazole-succinocarboxamide synthase